MKEKEAITSKENIQRTSTDEGQSRKNEGEAVKNSKTEIKSKDSSKTSGENEITSSDQSNAIVDKPTPSSTQTLVSQRKRKNQDSEKTNSEPKQSGKGLQNKHVAKSEEGCIGDRLAKLEDSVSKLDTKVTTLIEKTSEFSEFKKQISTLEEELRRIKANWKNESVAGSKDADPKNANNQCIATKPEDFLNSLAKKPAIALRGKDLPKYDPEEDPKQLFIYYTKMKWDIEVKKEDLLECFRNKFNEIVARFKDYKPHSPFHKLFDRPGNELQSRNGHPDFTETQIRTRAIFSKAVSKTLFLCRMAMDHGFISSYKLFDGCRIGYKLKNPDESKSPNFIIVTNNESFLSKLPEETQKIIERTEKKRKERTLNSNLRQSLTSMQQHIQLQEQIASAHDEGAPKEAKIPKIQESPTKTNNKRKRKKKKNTFSTSNSYSFETRQTNLPKTPIINKVNPVMIPGPHFSQPPQLINNEFMNSNVSGQMNPLFSLNPPNYHYF